MNNTDNLYDSCFPENSFEELSSSDSYLQQNLTEQPLSTESSQHQNPYEQTLNDTSYSHQNHYEQSFKTESFQHQNFYELPLKDVSYSHHNPYELSLGNELYQQQNPHASYSDNAHSNLNLTDAGIIEKFHVSISNDGLLDRKEMISLMEEAKDDGQIDANELKDLRNILGNNDVEMPEDVRVLSYKIVYSDPANNNSGIGNLHAGSSDKQMDQLIDKWLLGEDKPELELINGQILTYQKVEGSLFQDGISIDDVKQQGLGDCYFLASLAAVADKYPEKIKEMIKDNGDGTYTVRFFIKENGKLNPDYVTVNSELPTSGNGKAVYADLGSDHNKHELWVPLVEKAYAQMNESGVLNQELAKNSYAQIQGGYSGDAMEHITGQPSEQFDLTSPNSEDKMISELNSRKIVTLESKDFKPDEAPEKYVQVQGYKIYETHAYVVKGYDPGTKKFSVHNPWGKEHAKLTWNEINQYFSQAYISKIQ